jgi:hypothetical protein
MARSTYRQIVWWNSGRRRRCVFCRRLSFLIDKEGKPVHKVCLDKAIQEQAGLSRATAGGEAA